MKYTLTFRVFSKKILKQYKTNQVVPDQFVSRNLIGYIFEIHRFDEEEERWQN